MSKNKAWPERGVPLPEADDVRPGLLGGGEDGSHLDVAVGGHLGQALLHVGSDQGGDEVVVGGLGVVELVVQLVCNRKKEQYLVSNTVDGG